MCSTLSGRFLASSASFALIAGVWLVVAFAAVCSSLVDAAEPPALLVAPFDKEDAEAARAAWARHLGMETEVTTSVGGRMRLIPPGEFLMGSPEAEEDRKRDETQHRVRLTKPFYLGVYEVTQQEYERIVGRNPSWFSQNGDGAASVSAQDTRRFPVEEVSWLEAAAYCNALSQKEGLTAHYTIRGDVVEIAGGKGYRLPTEAEWEYACRAGTSTSFSFGDTLNGREANCNGNYPYGTTKKGPNLERPTRVGSYAANGFGLCDLHGNVWEWCQDGYDGDYYESFGGRAAEDPTGPASEQESRVLRGGSWNFYARNCRCASRDWNMPDHRHSYYGFRLARTP